ncbi:response regulator transcription factor [Eggerthella sinensis]|uniref:response regulator transcription factor n=1 Tax=Eggerthella sinensis TaxID=242230 RepID=UPI001D06B211|nr:response regulator transcription factor [Eggerthella sinensis]MCB7037674.1 response regulator transcription factor [Eggerthella sinensis]
MSEHASILIIEDDAAINEVVAVHLRRNGFACTQAFSGSEGRLLLGGGQPFDLVITDLMLPGMAGEDVVRLVRASVDVPVIVMSARTTAADKVALLKLGADDYLTKPFDLDELLARVCVQLRHAERRRPSAAAGDANDAVPAPCAADRATGSSAATMRYKDWTVDTDARTLCVQGDAVRLTRLEFNIVEALVRRPRKVFTKRELFEIAWNEESAIEEKAINVHVSNIRGKLRAAGSAGEIETVWGIGFKLAE